MQRMHFILLDCVSVTSYHILRELNKMADFRENQGCQLPLGMISLNDGPSMLNHIDNLEMKSFGSKEMYISK